MPDADSIIAFPAPAASSLSQPRFRPVPPSDPQSQPALPSSSSPLLLSRSPPCSSPVQQPSPRSAPPPPVQSPSILSGDNMSQQAPWFALAASFGLLVFLVLYLHNLVHRRGARLLFQDLGDGGDGRHRTVVASIHSFSKRKALLGWVGGVATDIQENDVLWSSPWKSQTMCSGGGWNWTAALVRTRDGS
eukprot:scaffold20579_cov92-Isochrysis_galbana.AAC.2